MALPTFVPDVELIYLISIIIIQIITLIIII